MKYLYIANVDWSSSISGPNSDEKCTNGDTKPADDGCNSYICMDGIWGGITLVDCFRPGMIYLSIAISLIVQALSFMLTDKFIFDYQFFWFQM